MKNFKKTEKYSIVAYLSRANYETVMRFVYEHATIDFDNEVEQRSCGELFMVTFNADKTREELINQLKTKFKDVKDLSTTGGLIFVKDEP